MVSIVRLRKTTWKNHHICGAGGFGGRRIFFWAARCGNDTKKKKTLGEEDIFLKKFGNLFPICFFGRIKTDKSFETTDLPPSNGRPTVFEKGPERHGLGEKDFWDWKQTWILPSKLTPMHSTMQTLIKNFPMKTRLSSITFSMDGIRGSTDGFCLKHEGWGVLDFSWYHLILWLSLRLLSVSLPGDSVPIILTLPGSVHSAWVIHDPDFDNLTK